MTRLALTSLLMCALLTNFAQANDAQRMLEFSYADVLAQDPDDAPPEIPVEPLEFGQPGHESILITGGGAFLGKDMDFALNAAAAYERFLAKRLQLSLELGAWWFDQDIDDAAAINFNVVFKWHFIERERFTIFLEAGAGVLLATDEVPNTGSEFNFTPRAGVGISHRLGDGPMRFVGGVRWQHISNARVFGTDRNPGSDMVMFFAGVSIPF